MKLSKRGGARANSGRKPLLDKKQQVALYFKSSTIQKIKIMNKEIKREIYNFIYEKFENENNQVLLIIILMLGLCFADNIF